MAADGTSGIAGALAAGMGQRMGEDDPPAQFLHLDDLAAAVVLAAEQRLDGVYNVAPDGWIAGERVRALAGRRAALKLPDRVSEVVTNLRWRFQRGPIPPGLRSYTRWPWLVANDRLKAEGWRPRSPTSRPTSKAPRRSGGRWCRRSAARSCRSAAGGRHPAGLVASPSGVIRRAQLRRRR